jgi:2-furoyl-CoA dehydrogenase FAD binding subunit
VKAAPFEYARPSSVAEAIELIGDPEAKAVAGGQSLVPMMSMRLARPRKLVDLGGLEELRGLEMEDGHVVIGAMVRQRTVEESSEVASLSPLVSAAMPWIGHREIRNRGTVGGSIAHADPAAELPAVTVTLDAILTAVGPDGERTIRAREFFKGAFQTTLDAKELLTAIRIPVARPGDGFFITEVARRHGDFALCGATAHIHRVAETASSAVVGLFGIGDKPVLLDAAQALDSDNGDRFERAAQQLAEGIEPSGDVHGSASYRRRLARTLIARSLTGAWEDARRRSQ